MTGRHVPGRRGTTVAEPPPARRRLLGAALRRHREGLGYSLADAARILECDPSKISRIETGHRGIRVGVAFTWPLGNLLGHYVATFG